MNYIKGRFSSGDFQHEPSENVKHSPKLSVSSMHDIVHQPTGIQSAAADSKGKSKILLIIDEHGIDWRKHFHNRKLFADYEIDVEQATFNEIHLSAYSDGGIWIHIDAQQRGTPVVRRGFRPDFVLVRQCAKDVGVDWTNTILGMQYGGVPSVNSMRAIYNFQDKPWIYAELLQIQRRLGAQQFPLINQVYYPNYRKMFISPPYPSVIKTGQAHHGLGKVLIRNTREYLEITNLIEVSRCYSTIEPYIAGQCDIYLQKIGHNYKAFRRTSSSRRWAAKTDSAEVVQLALAERYRLWLDEVSRMFGGLDLCAIEIVQSNEGKEFIIGVNDCTMQLVGERQEEDRQSIAELVIHKMEIYCRPDQQLSMLTRISSFDQLPEVPDNDPQEPVAPVLNTHHTDDTLASWKRIFAEFFGNIIS